MRGLCTRIARRGAEECIDWRTCTRRELVRWVAGIRGVTVMAAIVVGVPPHLERRDWRALRDKDAGSIEYSSRQIINKSELTG